MIPRLELCAANLLVNLYLEMLGVFLFKITRTVFWSDSTIVLQWINKNPKDLNVFEIRKCTLKTCENGA